MIENFILLSFIYPNLFHVQNLKKAQYLAGQLVINSKS